MEDSDLKAPVELEEKMIPERGRRDPGPRVEVYGTKIRWAAAGVLSQVLLSTQEFGWLKIISRPGDDSGIFLKVLSFLAGNWIAILT